jgi:hypothetical protein
VLKGPADDTVLVGPMDLFGVGRFAVGLGPAGAAFQL